MKNGNKTYSKTSFKETSHPRGGGGTFKKSSHTEEDDVSYHHKFTGKSHPRKKDGSFSNGTNEGIRNILTPFVCTKGAEEIIYPVYLT